MSLDQFYLAYVVIQLIHSQEEIHTGFHKEWPVVKLTKKQFVIFELIFSILIIIPIFLQFPYRDTWMTFFIFLMLANGLEHVIWAIWKRTYVPGFFTAPLFLALFLLYFLS